MKAQVKVLIQLEDERDLAFLGYMQGYFDKVFQRFVFDTDKLLWDSSWGVCLR